MVALALAAAVVLAACVTEQSGTPTKGIRFASSPAAAGSDTPVARPADPDAVSSGRIVFVVKPLGTVAFDGLTLPIVSPDGRFIAVQHGGAPSWPTILAEPGQASSPATRLSVYEIDAAAGTLRRQASRRVLPPGLILGRGADETGFLVEYPRPRGARWIGRIPWSAGSAAEAVTWLVQGDSDNAHAIVTPQGVLLFTRRPAGSDEGRVLVIRDLGGGSEHEVALHGATVQHPIAWRVASPEGTPRLALGAVLVDTAGNMSLRSVSPIAGGWRFSEEPICVLARWADPMLAFQTIAGMDPRHQSGEGPHVLLFSPDIGCALLIQPAVASITQIGERASAATILTFAQEGPLVAWAGGDPPGLRVSSQRDAGWTRLSVKPLVPRAVQGRTPHLLSFGPAGSPEKPVLEVSILRPVEPVGSD